MSMNVYLDMVGCRLNQSEIEAMANQLRVTGYTIVPTAAEADFVIVNTCCVTAKAAADSRKMIRHHARLSEGKIILTGCWSSLNIQEALDLPKVSAVVTNGEKEKLVKQYFPESSSLQDKPASLIRFPLPGVRHRTRAFIKVQDGCNDHCTFCITRIARGSSHSVPVPTIMRDIKAAVDGGSQEIVLTGVQIGSYGRDSQPYGTLASLVEKITNRFPELRVGISSIEPWDVEELLIEQWQKPNLNRHLHIPIQSGSDSILRRMARRITVSEIYTLVEKLKTKIPDVAITSDMIVGFTGETEQDFVNSMHLIEELHLSGGHVFSFSPMPGTPAFRYPDQVDNSLCKERNQKMRELFKRCSMEFMQANLQQEAKVLWEDTKNMGNHWNLIGHTDNYIRVKANSPYDLYNTISRVLLTSLCKNEELLLGKIIE